MADNSIHGKYQNHFADEGINFMQKAFSKMPISTKLRDILDSE